MFTDFGTFEVGVSAEDADGAESQRAAHTIQLPVDGGLTIEAHAFGENVGNVVVVNAFGSNVVVSVDGTMVLDTDTADLPGGLTIAAQSGRDTLVVDPDDDSSCDWLAIGLSVDGGGRYRYALLR